MTTQIEQEQAYRVEERLGMLYGALPVTPQQRKEVEEQVKADIKTILENQKEGRV